MFTVVPAISFILIFLLIQQGSRNDTRSLRNALLISSITWGVLVVSGTEILSAFKLITFSGILIFWLMISFATLFILLIFYHKHKAPIGPFSINLIRELGEIKNRHPRSSLLFLISVCFIAFVVCMIAVVAPPNNHDSMVYHMSRVAHWVQNQSVDHYPTSVLRQNLYSPWSEYAILHLQILNHGDRFANLIQWFCLLGCIVVASLIAKEYGGNSRVQIITAVMTATIPMGILQGSSTQNDLANAFWLSCLIYYILRFKKESSWINLLAIGGSLGLALYTKATAYLFAFPFMIWLLFIIFKKYKSYFWKPLFIILFIAMAINSSHYLRNYRSFGHPLTTGYISNLNTNEVITITVVLSNITRNLSLHLVTPFESINHSVEKGIRWFHQLINADIEDPRTTFQDTQFTLKSHGFHEDFSGNTLHFLLIIACITLILFNINKNSINELSGYLLSITLAFLLSILMLKWNPWNSRYHLPLFVFCAPVIGVVFGNVIRPKVGNILSVLLILTSLLPLFLNYSRPIIGNYNIFKVERTRQYFRNSFVELPYTQAVEYVKTNHHTKIGLVVTGNSYEYPIWALLDANNQPDIRIEHINYKENPNRFYCDDRSDAFDLTVMIYSGEQEDFKIALDNERFIKTRKYGSISVFVKDTTGHLVRENLIYHLNKRAEYANIADLILGKCKNVTDVRMKDKKKIIQYKLMELKEAQLVDTEELERIQTGLGRKYEQELLKGLELYINGCMYNNTEKCNEGKALIKKWDSWFSNHGAVIDKRFENIIQK